MTDGADGASAEGSSSHGQGNAQKLDGTSRTKSSRARVAPSDANKYRPFRLVEEEVTSNLRTLINHTKDTDVLAGNGTMMAGALSLALAFINKQTLAYSESNGGAGARLNGAGESAEARDIDNEKQGLQSRILIVSVSSDTALQYIPVMNCIFAAQRNVGLRRVLWCAIISKSTN